MRMNPEFRRNIWLEITPARLVGMPLVLAAILLLAFFIDNKRFASGVSGTALTLFLAISLIWGAKLATESVMNEIRDHTWDSQRMSALSPWQLTWGKLFGSTIYTWYGALLCLLVFGMAARMGKEVGTERIMLALALAGVLSQSVGLLSSLIMIRKERRFMRSQAAALLLLGIIVQTPFAFIYRSTAVLRWYGIRCTSLDFTVLSILSLALWTICGVYRLMRAELQMKNMPWTWYCFVLYLMGYVGGFYVGTGPGKGALQGSFPQLLAAFAVAIVITYFMAFAERKDFLLLHRAGTDLRAGNWRAFALHAPFWLLNVPVVVLAMVMNAIVSSDVSWQAVTRYKCFVLGIVLYQLRDLALILYFNFARNPKRADMIAVLSLALLYGIIPAILTAIGLDKATLLFWPRPDLNPYLGLVAPFVELVIISWLLVHRWKQRLAEGRHIAAGRRLFMGKE